MTHNISVSDRAAQFAPFAALTGHGDAIDETARLTDRKIELDESRKETIDKKLRMISEYGDTLQIEVTCFVPDRRKDGGEYAAVTGTVKKVDAVSREITMSDGRIIPIENIYDVRFL
jgi:hypothetical protein